MKDFAEVVRESAELTGECQEATAIQVLLYIKTGLIGKPESWDERILPEVNKALKELLEYWDFEEEVPQ